MELVCTATYLGGLCFSNSIGLAVTVVTITLTHAVDQRLYYVGSYKCHPHSQPIPSFSMLHASCPSVQDTAFKAGIRVGNEAIKCKQQSSELLFSHACAHSLQNAGESNDYCCIPLFSVLQNSAPHTARDFVHSSLVMESETPQYLWIVSTWDLEQYIKWSTR